MPDLPVLGAPSQPAGSPAGESVATRQRRWAGNRLARDAESSLGHVALIGIGPRWQGPLLLVASANVDQALDQAQVYHNDQVMAFALAWALGKPVADRVKPEILRLARERRVHGRGGFILMAGDELTALMFTAAKGIGLAERLIRASAHDDMVRARAEGGVW